MTVTINGRNGNRHRHPVPKRIPCHCLDSDTINQYLSRLLEEPSLVTTLQGIYFIFYICFAAKCVGPRWPSSSRIHFLTFNNEVICPSLDNSQTHIKKATAVFAKHIQ
jgi:hypothetical protein